MSAIVEQVDPAQSGYANIIATSLLATIILLFGFWRGLPKPLPDIPYNKDIGYLGDLPSLGSHVMKTGQFWAWLSQQNLKHQSPLVQVFTSPFSNKPMLVLADAREAQDVMLRRADEFDRSSFSIDFIKGIVPRGMFTLKSGHVWKAHRALTKDLMTPQFLRNVSGPAVFVRALDLMELWHTKAKLAKGKPFAAEYDIHFTALDAIFDAAFGTEDGFEVLRARNKHLLNVSSPIKSTATTGVVTFSEPVLPKVIQAINALDDSTEYALASMVPSIAWKIMAWLPWYSNAWKEKEAMLTRLIEKSRDRVERKATKEQAERCALDNIVSRELGIAAKANRAPDFASRDFRDEAMGYVIGGYDTTSTTTRWGVKYLTEHQDAQIKFRDALKSGLSAAQRESRQPTLEEILSLKAPYVDAILEEMIRHSMTLPGSQRQATRDTVLLGHHVPKGTEVFVLSNGPDFFTSGFTVPEEKRSASCQEALATGRTYGAWETNDMAAFKPERWLVRQDDGQVAFNKMAGLHLTFGLGPRGCFGKRLAELEFRVFLCLMVWNFYFDPINEDLASHEYVDKLTRIPRKCYVSLRPVL